MARKFQIKRGLLAKIPTLAQGEFGMTTNSGSERLFIGTGSQNLEIPFLRGLDAYKVGAVPSSLGDGYRLIVARGDRSFINFNLDQSVPVLPVASNYTHFITVDNSGNVVTSISVPLDSTDKAYYYSYGRGEWLQIATTDSAVSKTGDQVMDGMLTMNSLRVTDGLLNVTISADAVMSRAQILASNPNSGEAGALMVGPSGLVFMDGNGYEYRVIHEGNMAQIMGVNPASIE